VAVTFGCNLVDRLGQLYVALADTLDIVGRQHDFDPVVDIEQLGVVIHLLGQQRDSRYEAPGLREIAEMIALADRIAVCDLDPAMESVKCRVPCCADQLLDHVALPFSSPSREVRDRAPEVKRAVTA
jgi:hypothetical protein